VREILSTHANISGATLAPIYWPARLYQICRMEKQPGIPIVYDFTVDTKLDYQIWFHFVEIDPTVINAGLCVFNVSINGLTVLSLLDLFQQGRANVALRLCLHCEETDWGVTHNFTCTGHRKPSHLWAGSACGCTSRYDHKPHRRSVIFTNYVWLSVSFLNPPGYRNLGVFSYVSI
jgi:hypothetical protein